VALLAWAAFASSLLYAAGRYAEGGTLSYFSAGIGALFLMFVTVVLYEGVSLGLRPFSVDRRRFLKRGVDGGSIGVLALLLGGSLWQGAHPPRVVRTSVAIPKLGAPLRLVQLSDVHLGNGGIGAEFIGEVIRRVNALEPDLVAITGDLGDRPAGELAVELELLAGIHAPMGRFYVPGNHEYFHGVEGFLTAMEKRGYTVLANRSVTVRRGSAAVNVAGLADRFGSRFGVLPPDPHKAFAAVRPDTPTILLAHQPKAVEELEGHRPDLMLSGHTHGGQIWPFHYLVRLAQPYLSGLHRHDETTQVYVSRGTGYWGPPMRLFAPPEISVLELVPA